jgi:hypothetical protein
VRRLFPYPVLAGAIELEVTRIVLDGQPLHLSMINAKERAVALNMVEKDGWAEARLCVKSRIRPAEQLTEGPWTDISVYATLTDRRTRTRTTTLLHEETAGEWTGEVELVQATHARRARLSALVSATVGERAHRLIGTSDDWTIDLEATAPSRSSAVRTVSVDFTHPDHPYLHAYRNDPWSVDVAGDEPVVYLNTRFEGLHALLESPDRVTREATAAQIATGVWTAMFHSAADAVEIEEGAVQWPEGWRNAVLRRMLPDVFPDLPADEALAELAARREPGVVGDLETRVIHAAGRRALLPRRLGALARTADRRSER